MEFNNREKALILFALSQCLKSLRDAENYFSMFKIKYRSKAYDSVMNEIDSLRVKIGGEEWYKDLRENIEGI